MNFRISTTCVSVMLILLGHLVVAGFFDESKATSIGVGLAWRKNVFVQEYWKDGSPYYLVANINNRPVSINVKRWYRDGYSSPVLAHWIVGAKATHHFDVDALRSPTGSYPATRYLLDFSLDDGQPFGLLNPPTPPPIESKAIATYYGLNGSGGLHHEVWCEQDSPSFKGGETIEIRLMIRGNSGVVTFRPNKRVYPLTVLTLRKALSNTLPITVDSGIVEINTNLPSEERDIHRIDLFFESPMVEEPTMVMITGWRQESEGRGHGITRGILLEPPGPTTVLPSTWGQIKTTFQE